MRSDLQRLKRDSESGHISAASMARMDVEEMRSAKDRGKTWKIAAITAMVAAAVAALVASGIYYFRSNRGVRLTEKDTIVVGDFENKTGDSVLDDTMNTALDVSLRQSPFLKRASGWRGGKNIAADDETFGHKTFSASGSRNLPAHREAKRI